MNKEYFPIKESYTSKEVEDIILKVQQDHELKVMNAIKKLRFTTKIKKGISRVEISQCIYTEELKDELNLEED